MTPAEHAELAASRARAADAEDAANQLVRAQCWDWPISECDRRRAQRAAEDPELQRAEQLASGLLDDWQADRCALCGARQRDLVIDHDHETGLVRGLLCRSCNTLEGFADDSSVYGRYRLKNPATILGLRIRYWDPFRGHAKPNPKEDMPIDDNHPAFVLGRLFGG